MAASQRIFLGNIKGEKGDTGTAATINVGTTTTTAAGGNAQVTAAGTANARIFNFQIPRGEPGAGGGITAVRSTTMPLVYRLQCPNPNYGEPIPGGQSWEIDLNPYAYPNGYDNFVGALSMLDIAEEPWIWYFTTNSTRALIRGWKSTIYTPNPRLDMFQPPAPCPANFGSLGYRGNWCRRDQCWDWDPADETVSDLLFSDYDALVFTNSRQALWVRRKDPGNPVQQSMITLEGLPTGTLTSLWAATSYDYSPTPGKDNWWIMCNWIYAIMGNQLYLAKFFNAENGSSTAPAVPRRITGPESLPFSPVTDATFGTIGAATRVYCVNGGYQVPPAPSYRVRVAVWGFTNALNRIAYFDGAAWFQITVPFSWTTSNTANAVIIFSDNRLGIYNPANGDYYTCANPRDASPQIVLRYRTRTGALLTRGFMLGMPQFLPRNTWENVGGVFAQFDSTTDDGGQMYASPHTRNEYFNWPSELWCSTHRPDFVPSNYSQHGYAYAYGTRTEYMSIQGDNQSFQSVSELSGQRLRNVPRGLQGCQPAKYLATPARRRGGTTGNDQTLTALTVFSQYANTIA